MRRGTAVRSEVTGGRVRLGGVSPDGARVALTTAEGAVEVWSVDPYSEPKTKGPKAVSTHPRWDFRRVNNIRQTLKFRQTTEHSSTVDHELAHCIHHAVKAFQGYAHRFRLGNGGDLMFGGIVFGRAL